MRLFRYLQNYLKRAPAEYFGFFAIVFLLAKYSVKYLSPGAAVMAVA